MVKRTKKPQAITNNPQNSPHLTPKLDSKLSKKSTPKKSRQQIYQENYQKNKESKKKLFKGEKEQKAIMIEGECSNCYEYKKVDAESGLCRGCGKE